MAFSARELRLVLSIQSYGTGNIQRLRRDIQSLSSQTRIANANQVQTLGKAEALSRSMVGTQSRLASLEKQRLSLGGITNLTRQKKLMEELNALGYRGAVLQDLLAGKGRARSAEAQAMINTIRSQAKAEEIVNGEIQRGNVLYGEQSAEIKRILADEMRRAAVIDEQVAAMNKMQLREARARTAAHVGRTAQFAGLIGLAGFGMAASSAAKFSQQVYLAATQTRDLNKGIGQTIANADKLTHGFTQAGVHLDGILQLMQKFPASGEEMAKASYDIFSSMDVTFPAGVRLLKVFNQLAVATGSDLATATSAGITVLNNFAGASKNVDSTLNLMVATIRFGRMRLDDFNQMLSKVAPAAASAGQSFKDVAGAMALITTRQPSPQMGATEIARLYQTFTDPDFQRGVYKFGVDITKGKGAVGVLKPLPTIIQQMNAAFGLYTRHGGVQQLFKDITRVGAGPSASGALRAGRASRIEAQRGYTFLIKNIKEYMRLQGRVTGDTNEFAKSLKAMSESPGVRWQVFINQMRAFVLTIGEAALPALLKIAGVIQGVVGWFEHLSTGTRKLIVYFGVFASAGLFIVGTFGNMVTSIYAAILASRIYSAQLKLMQTQMELTGVAAQETAAKVDLMSIGLKGAAAIGLISIPIVMQAIKGGDPDIWTLLTAAGFGGLAGSQFGPYGAAIGALTVPLIIELQSKLTQPKDPVKEVYQKYLQSVNKNRSFLRKYILDPLMTVGATGVGGSYKIPKSVPALTFEQWLKDHPKYAKMEAAERHHGNNMNDIRQRYNKMQKDMLAQQVIDQYSQADQLAKLANQENSTSSQAARDAVSIAKSRATAIHEAHQKELDTIKTALDNMMQIYDNFRQQNQQALGGIFQGPVMGGMLGQIFSDLNDQLRQFGVQIPIPFNLLKKDMDQSLTYAKRWFADIRKLRKAGVPEDVIQQIEGLGIEKGLPIAEGMIAQGKKAAKALGETWHKAIGPNGLIAKQTQQDMHAQEKYWNTFGHNAAWQMAQGIINNPYEAAIRKNFRTYITDTFGDILKKQMAADVAAAMKYATDKLAAGNKAKNKQNQQTAGGVLTSQYYNAVIGKPFASLPKSLQQAIINTDLGTLGVAAGAEGSLQSRLARVNRQIALVSPPGPPGTPRMPIPPYLIARRKKILAEIKQQQAKEARLTERLYIERQLAAHPGRAFNITYGGQTVHITADGASVASVVRALNKAAQRQKNRPKNKGGRR